MRIGCGFDVHRLVPGRRLILGGVAIPYHLGLEGHSDAEVLLHALADALLGAAALGDIGGHFPPGDPRYKDADSLVLLQEAYRLVRARGYRLANADAVVIAEAPRLAPFIVAMRERIATALAVAEEQVSIKATTTKAWGIPAGVRALPPKPSFCSLTATDHPVL
jgi:2-C-methyl-D-erythritol 2,4-cyclodiphosphate synthase